MSETRNKRLLVVDSGLYTHMAEVLARGFGHTYYFAEWREQFPSSKRAQVGQGLDFERVDSLWDTVDKVDMIAFLDVYAGDVQTFLRSRGARIWGNGGAEILELDRWSTKKLLRTAGMATNKIVHVTGLEELIEHLKDLEDKWVKGGQFRGDFESFHYENLWLSKPWFDELRHSLGPRAASAEFLVEDPIEGVEVGYDGFSVDGEFPSTASYGYEDKDAGYLGRVYEQAPPVIEQVCAALKEPLRQHEARGFLSIEFRQGKLKRPFIIDPCLRCGSPPSEAYSELFTNWSEIVWHGSAGQLVEPTPRAKFAAQLVLRSDWAIDNWLAVEVPPSVSQWVKLHNHCRIDNVDYCVPGGIKEVGGVVGLGDTLAEAIQACTENAEAVKAYQLDFDTKSFDRMIDKIEEGEKYGIPW